MKSMGRSLAFGIFNELEAEMRNIIVVIILYCFSCIAFGQSETKRYYFEDKCKSNVGLSYSGVVEGIVKRETQYTVIFRLKLRMALKNIGKQDLILLSEDPLREVLFASDTYENAMREMYIHEENMGYSNDSTSDAWKHRRQFLDSHLPPNDMTMILKKGESKQFLVQIPLMFDKSCSIKRPREEEREILWSEASALKTLYLRIVFHAWNANLEEGWYSAKSKFGKKLQKKWKSIGYLYLDDIITDPIEVKLDGGMDTAPGK